MSEMHGDIEKKAAGGTVVGISEHNATMMGATMYALRHCHNISQVYFQKWQGKLLGLAI